MSGELEVGTWRTRNQEDHGRPGNQEPAFGEAETRFENQEPKHITRNQKPENPRTKLRRITHLEDSGSS